MSMRSDKVEMSFRSKKIATDQVIAVTQKILVMLNESFLPVPNRIDQTDQKEVKISGYQDNKIMLVAENECLNKQFAFVLWGADPDFSVAIGPSAEEYYLSIDFPFHMAAEITTKQIRDLFLSLCQFLNPEIAICYARRAFLQIRERHFEWECRTPNFDYFSWLQYFGPKEFRLQGGEAIFQNPYIKAEKMGEGVFIQVGENPLDAHTPEGEELIVKATRALPPVVKE